MSAAGSEVEEALAQLAARIEELAEAVAAEHEGMRRERKALKSLATRLESIDRKLGPPRALIDLLVRQAGALDALLRSAYVDPDGLPFPERLTAQRFGLHSQDGEDGIVLALLRAAGVATSRFVELGCGPNGGNSGLLA